MVPSLVTRPRAPSTRTISNAYDSSSRSSARTQCSTTPRLSSGRIRRASPTTMRRMVPRRVAPSTLYSDRPTLDRAASLSSRANAAGDDGADHENQADCQAPDHGTEPERRWRRRRIEGDGAVRDSHAGQPVDLANRGPLETF